MAGSNQALRLQGMLSDIANTVGQMGAASNWTAQNVRDYMAPDLDPSSEESLLKRQQWAMRNGYQDQANALGVSLGNLRQANQQKAAKSELAQMQTTMAQLEQERQNALANLTVPGGGPPSDAQIAEVNKNFAQAAQQLSGRIAQTAGGIDGSTGMEGAEALAGYQSEVERKKRTENFKTILVNSGKAEWAPMAEYIDDPAVLQDIITGNAGVDPTSSFQTAQLLADSRNARLGLKPGDPGYMSVDEMYTQVISRTDPTTQADLAASKAGGTAQGQLNVEDKAEVASAYAGAERQIQNYQSARDVVEGMQEYSFGPVSARFPNLTNESIVLNNFRTEMGLQVIANGNFGQLNESELRLALETPLPSDLDKQGTLDFIDRRIQAEREVANAARDYLIWYSEQEKSGNVNRSVGDYKTHLLLQQEAEVSGSDNDGVNLSSPTPSNQSTVNTTANGVTYEVEE
jgi:hypothetical protein